MTLKYLLLIVAAAALTLVPVAFGFTRGRTATLMRRSNLVMKSGNSLTTTNVQLTNCEVTLRGLSMTDALQSKLESKIVDGVVSKLGENLVTSTHITMSIDPKAQSCDVRCNMKGGAVVEAKEQAENMYTSIDLCTKTLGNNLKKFREKIQDKKAVGNKLGGTDTEDELDIINEVPKSHRRQTACIPAGCTSRTTIEIPKRN